MSRATRRLQRAVGIAAAAASVVLLLLLVPRWPLQVCAAHTVLPSMDLRADPSAQAKILTVISARVVACRAS